MARKALERAELASGSRLDRERCLAFGDTPVDVDAAHGGIRIVGVATGEYDAAALEAAGADHVVATLEELLPI